MPKFNLEIPHQLSGEEAKERLARFTEALSSKFQGQVEELEQSWNGDTLSFGVKTFGFKIESEIRQQLERILR